MSSAIRERLEAARRSRFVGRKIELDLFLSALMADSLPFHVLYLFGPGGIGKTTLLKEFVNVAGQAGATVIEIDGRHHPPSPETFKTAVEQALAANPTHAQTILLVDTYENLLPLDSWLRDTFLPQLPDHMLVVLSGRQPPATGWRTDPGWQSLVRVLPLRNLEPQASETYLNRQQIPADHHKTILDFTHGHPLALSLVVESFAQQPNGLVFHPKDTPDIIKPLLEHFVQNVPTPAHRAALEACALVRTLTEPLLATLLAVDEEEVRHLFAWLRQLSFIDAGQFGIYPHDLARDVLAVDLRWRNPQQYAQLHQQARNYYKEQFATPSSQIQHQIIFDYVFLHRNNPTVRPYVEWQSGNIYADNFHPDDLETLLDTIQTHEGETAATIAGHWLQQQPESICLFRGKAGQLQGALIMVAVDKTTEAERRQDPAIAAAWHYLKQFAPLRSNERATYFRFWMATDTYQDVSATQSQIFLNMVHHYLTTSGLAFSFVACADPDFWADIFAHVNLKRLEAADFQMGNKRFGVFGHDWRVLPPLAWVSVLAEKALTPDQNSVPHQTVAPIFVLSEDEFATAVRTALRHVTTLHQLADNALLRSRLVVEHSSANGDGRQLTQVLQNLIIEAVNRLQESPRQLKQYRALYHTYLQPAPSQEKAAELLTLPYSTYRRHLKSGIESITEMLWQMELSDLY